MRQRLFPNIKRMTGIFCAGIILITFLTLVLRLTLLSGMAETIPTSGSLAQGSMQSGGNGDQPDYTINTKVYFASPDAKGNLRVTNSDHNEHYIRVDLRLNDTGKSVYYSGDIAPGTPINTIRLQGDPLEEGVYECTATITAYDMKTRDKVSNDEIAITLYIGIKPEKA